MPSRDERSPRGFDWPAIIKTLSVEIVILLALAGAFVGYLDWSSEVNVREFMATSQSSVADLGHRPPSSMSVQAVKARANCNPEI
jgi:hypothetical protein